MSDITQEFNFLQGVKVVDFPTGWDREATVVVAQDLPLPCTVRFAIATFSGPWP